MKSFKLLIILVLACNISFSQALTKKEIEQLDAKIDSLKKIDFLSYNYKYLDKDFKIKIPKDVYEKTIVQYKFYPERILNYKDSLGVVLTAELKDLHAVNIASLRINYEWKRVGYHAWMSEKQVLDLAQKLEIKQPYRLQELFLNNDPKVKSEIDDLRNQLYAKLGEENIKTMPSNKLLMLGFKYNPELIELRKKGHKHNPNQDK